MDKSISFGISNKDKKTLVKKAEELGISLSGMIRNIILEKYRSLSIGYFKASNIQASHDIDIKGLKPPPISGIKTKERVSMGECIVDLKTVFAKGINILENMEKSGMMVKARFKVKTDKELEQALRNKNARLILKRISYAFKLILNQKA